MKKHLCGYDICCHPLHRTTIGCGACHFWRQPIIMDIIKAEQDKENEEVAEST